jgi:hypothetical protein
VSTNNFGTWSPGIIDLMADENENDEDDFRFALRGNVFSELLSKGNFLSSSRAYGC